MEIALIALAVVALVFATLVTLTLVLRRTVGPPMLGRTVVIHTRKPDDRSLRGILHGQHADRWILREAVMLEGGGREIALGGIEHVPVDNIAFVQEIEGPKSSNGRVGKNPVPSVSRLG